MTSVTNQEIQEDIFEAIANIYGFKILEFSQIELGYMNLKWKIKTNAGDLFVKQYNKVRYPNHMIPGVETSLNLQSFLHREGIPCPNLYTHQGKYVIQSSKGERFVLMGICEGNSIKPGTANEEQMYHLGRIIGRMHKILNHNHSISMPLHWDVRSKESMIHNWKERWNEAIRLNDDSILPKLEIQRLILDRNEVDIFAHCEKGWGHWDLFVDNILFKSDSVSAILDFDRMNYVFTEFDISRSILSCCLDEKQIQISKVSAFVKGYREHQKLTNQKVVRSIKLTWWKEAEWVRVKNIEKSPSLKRFIEENIWVGDHWDELEGLFTDIY